MRINVITPPSAEPLTVDEMRTYLRIDGTDEDATITALIAGARDWCESFTRRALIERTVDVVLDRFPPASKLKPKREIVLPFGRAQSVTAIYYTDTAGVQQTLTGPDASPAGTAFQQDLSDDYHGVIAPGYGLDWPDTRDVIGAVKVRCTVGYGTASDIPAQLRDAMRFRIASLYEGRGEQDVKQWVGVDEALARPYQIDWFGAC
jgi:uncharacterized phiE125 gp8 family phage protein